MVLVGLDAEQGSSIDFTSQSLSEIEKIAAGQLSVYTSEKNYTKIREQELFGLTEKGASISDGTYFKSICLLL
jgi:hypothetical protein